LSKSKLITDGELVERDLGEKEGKEGKE